MNFGSLELHPTIGLLPDRPGPRVNAVQMAPVFTLSAKRRGLGSSRTSCGGGGRRARTAKTENQQPRRPSSKRVLVSKRTAEERTAMDDERGPSGPGLSAKNQRSYKPCPCKTPATPRESDGHSYQKGALRPSSIRFVPREVSPRLSSIVVLGRARPLVLRGRQVARRCCPHPAYGPSRLVSAYRPPGAHAQPSVPVLEAKGPNAHSTSRYWMKSPPTCSRASAGGRGAWPDGRPSVVSVFHPDSPAGFPRPRAPPYCCGARLVTDAPTHAAAAVAAGARALLCERPLCTGGPPIGRLVPRTSWRALARCPRLPRQRKERNVA